jgi:lipid II:glycine glycyltransferase (peptidoglycan interpeptide bridge formation enzyme)
MLLLAVDSSGAPLAGLIIAGCGQRIVDLHGGTTSAGEDRCANHLLKAEAILIARTAGYLEYDLGGLPNAGVAAFKRGFGGREIETVGFWTLVTDPLAYRAVRLSRRIHHVVRRGGRHPGSDDPHP